MSQVSKTQPNLNWLDKTILALGKLAIGEVRVNVHIMRIMISGSIFINIVALYGFCYRWLGIVGGLPHLGQWEAFGLLVILGLCYLPIYFATHSAVEIESADLSGWERWGYTALGLFIFPLSWLVWGMLLMWLESGL